MMHLCEGCRAHTDLYYCRTVDEYLCEGCIGEVVEEPEPEEPLVLK